ncbi:actin-binding Rho-activating protein isoform X2 [Eublepharis macularius]|uniref:Actin-binding Rho-activating protein n=1 Tax=Eublepharis macularius TaxID=481883 RepID=A0AA97L6E4_EUBMA|nr:actin-binding Rho-activating protein isoform X2 [Eublepharis macularius]
MPAEEHQNALPAKRAIKKIRTASLVISLARGWQQWATDHCTKQAEEPSGWVPNEEKPLSIPSEGRICPKPPTFVKKDQAKHEVKFPSEGEAPKENEGQSPSESEEALQKLHIRSKEVTKTVVNKIYERGSGVNFLSNKYEKDHECPETDKDTEDLRNIDKLLSSKTSPTRRRKCSNLVSELTKGWKQIEHEDKTSEIELHNCRSDSLDTEDSGYGGVVEDRLDSEDSSEEIVSAIRIKRPTSSIEEFDYDLAMSTRLHKGDEGYGHPKEGTKTAERAKRAEAHIYREMKDLCFIIRTMASLHSDGKMQVTFGELFERYVRISDKVVGILMRARKHGLVNFEGEMLWQGRDDNVIITLLE